MGLAMYLEGMSRGNGNRTMPKSTPIGELVRRYRRGLGMTQQELGREIGLSKGAVSAIENGGTLEPEVPTRLRLAKVFGIDVEEIEHAVRLSVQGLREQQRQMFLSGPHTPDEYFEAVLEQHGGDLDAALRFLNEAQAAGFKRRR